MMLADARGRREPEVFKYLAGRVACGLRRRAVAQSCSLQGSISASAADRIVFHAPVAVRPPGGASVPAAWARSPRQFFARTMPDDDLGGRLYVRLAAPGISPRVVFLRGVVTLMSAAQYAWDAWAGKPAENPADAYMTLIAYFNALRELGAAR
jgi:hypothetical protein